MRAPDARRCPRPRHLLAGGRALRALIDSGEDRSIAFSKSHRMLLPAEQNGWIILVGATRIFVRGQLAADVLEPVFRFEALEDQEVIDLLRRALADSNRRGTEGRVP